MKGYLVYGEGRSGIGLICQADSEWAWDWVDPEADPVDDPVDRVVRAYLASEASDRWLVWVPGEPWDPEDGRGEIPGVDSYDLDRDGAVRRYACTY